MMFFMIIKIKRFFAFMGDDIVLFIILLLYIEFAIVSFWISVGLCESTGFFTDKNRVLSLWHVF